MSSQPPQSACAAPCEHAEIILNLSRAVESLSRQNADLRALGGLRRAAERGQIQKPSPENPATTRDERPDFDFSGYEIEPRKSPCAASWCKREDVHPEHLRKPR